MGVDDVLAAAEAARESSMRWHERESAENALAPPRFRFRIGFTATKDVATRIIKLMMELDTGERTYSGPPLELIPNTRGGEQ